jgi:DNA-binding transcriptional MerR regulator
MLADISYEVQVVARAVDIPARRLEGWVERRVVVPTVPASGTGTRARFSPQDVLRIAVIAEIQRLFGTDFRPGGIAVAIGRDPFMLPWLDTAFTEAIQENPPGLQSADSGTRGKRRLLFYVYRNAKGRPDIGFTRKTPDEILKTTPVLLLIDSEELWRRIRPRLKDQPGA